MIDWIEWQAGMKPPHPNALVELAYNDCQVRETRWAGDIDWTDTTAVTRYRVRMPGTYYFGDTEASDDVSATLAEREHTHGSFVGLASVSQALKGHVRAALMERNRILNEDQDEAIEMICTKIARIVNGNPDEVDHWRDIAGYAQLVAERLSKEPA